MRKKILVISLLRLGDVLMTAPVLKGLRKKYPDAQIHLLLNRQCSGVIPLLKLVDRFIEFDRQALQDSLVSAERPLFEAYDALRGMIEELNLEDYDQLVNLTHNKLSGWLSGVIDAKEKRGLVLQTDGSVYFGSPWFRYLNSHVEAGAEHSFHFIDVFSYGSGMESSCEMELSVSEEDKKWATEVTSGKSGHVVIQPLTSDAKKSWPLERWSDLIQQMTDMGHRRTVYVLAAPFEVEVLNPWLAELQAKNLLVTLAAVDLGKALALMQTASVIVTGDTSIKHLACASPATIVELSLGSSDYRKTGAYKTGSLILQGLSSCAPCSHSANCHRPTHECGLNLEASCVAAVVHRVLTGTTDTLPLVAKQFSDRVKILRTHKTALGYWMAQPIYHSRTEDGLSSWLEFSSWKLFLEREFEKPLGEFGSESLRLGQSMSDVFAGRRDLIGGLTEIEKKACGLEADLSHLEFYVRNAHKKHMLDELKQIAEKFYPTLRSRGDNPLLLESLSGLREFRGETLEFKELRALKMHLSEAMVRNRIKIKLISHLKNQLRELPA